MATATSGKKNTRRSGVRRAGESAYGLLLVGRNAVLSAVALLLLVAGVWTSWGTAQHVMLEKGREQGSMVIERCGAKVCTGRFTPGDPARLGREVTVDRAVSQGKGLTLAVAVKPGTDEVVRKGVSGVLHAWVPFAGSMVLASLVIAGGLRMRRTAWVVGLLGVGLLAGSYATL